MNETVAQRTHVCRSSRAVLDHPPRDDRHGGVVVDVKERDLVVLLADDEEERVKELDKLGGEVPPVSVDESHGDWRSVRFNVCFVQ